MYPPTLSQESPSSPFSKCPECSGQVSMRAVACPHCGHPLEASTTQASPAFRTAGVITSNVATYGAVDAPITYQGSTAIQGWSAWMGLGLFAALICALVVLPSSVYGFVQLGGWIAFTCWSTKT